MIIYKVQLLVNKTIVLLTCGKVFYEIGYIKIEKYFNAF